MARHHVEAPRREPPPDPSAIDASDKDARIEHLADLMVLGLYRTRHTARELAPVWGLSHRTIENDACDAARMIRVGPEKREAYQAMQMAKCEALEHEARTTFSSITGMPDFNAAAKFIELASKYAGVDVDAAPAKREPLEIRFVSDDIDDAADEENDPPGEGPEGGVGSAPTG